MNEVNNNDTFGRWVVLDNTPIRNSHGDITVKCQCTCDKHTTRMVRKMDLLKGNSKSCGCVASEMSRKRYAKRDKGDNAYTFTEDYGVCTMKDGDTFIFDIEDYDKLKSYTWHKNEARGGYVVANGRASLNNKKTSIQLARLIMGLETGDKRKVDHINHDIYDNRKSNLRICTNMQNNWNKLEQWDNTSGHVGVSLRKRGDGYEAHITVNGKRYNKSYNIKKCGSQENAYRLACQWYEEMSLKLHGEYSPFNY